MERKIKKVLVANRGEIAIRIFRACKELGIRTVAMYSKEDKYALFRIKSDESYLIGEKRGPIEAYLNIEDIINLALKKGVDAIHPGYGFLSENPDFARKCEENGIIFIGPKSDMIDNLGDKIKSKMIAKSVGVPTVPGLDEPITDETEAIGFAAQIGFPVIIKAAAGGGGRGMRIVYEEKEFVSSYRSARSEARKAFGNDAVFIEKYLDRPKHIEVQLLGDLYGNIVHLFERDCSIQRRHQKIIEFAPALSITEEKRKAICEDALKIARKLNYESAGTIEFLMDSTGQHYFIEMNPRIQVEHTITEMITGIDIVQSQLLIAQGYPLDSPEIGIKSQEDIEKKGYAIQCRITTEDPFNNFAPDTGKITEYRSGSGFGIRLDGGNGYTGSTITPYYDSLLVKIVSWSRTFDDAVRKASRSIKELSVKGVKTNEDFIINVLNHPTFKNGECTTGFIDETPELFDIRPKKDKETKIIKFIGEKLVNEIKDTKKDFDIPKVPQITIPENLSGTKQILDEKGVKGLIDWIKSQNKLLLTDTTYRDAHQSLVATRLRTKDILKISEATSVLAKDLFSLEMWGGATFDVSYRFLKESPWRRLQMLRSKVPNILFQMLVRGSNAVGYTNYPDNVIREFIRESAKQGIDIFRIFDSLNWLKGMEVALDEALKSGKVAEVAICYTGDILDEKREKYSLKYYVDTAVEIERMGAHILGIKDMAGLLKPYAAKKLVETLKRYISIPIHLHTHDTSGNGIATVMMAANAGVDIADAAFNSMAGLTSQPALNSIVAALANTDRDTGIGLDDIQKLSDYWYDTRKLYEPFESGLKSGTAEIYRYEIPGGQYSNLRSQVESFGMGHLFDEVKLMYKDVNELLGDIVKVTPSSKVVGDLAIFMVKNGLTKDNILEKGRNLNYPDSAVSYFKGMMGQPVGGFPEELQKIVLKGEAPITVRPGEILEPADFDDVSRKLADELHDEPNIRNILSYALYPKVYKDYLKFINEYGDLSNLESHVFFYGLREGETCEIELEEGKIMIVKLIEMQKVDQDGYVTVVFEINGNRREIKIFDKAYGERSKIEQELMANPSDINEIGASIPGVVSKILVQEGDNVNDKQSLIIVEAMKMETNILAPKAGKIEKIYVKEGQQIKAGQLLIELA
ncbi:MAG: pyruvate carboxylase [Caulobacteraceae bacterium]